jgi:hypothetical protein
VQYDLLAAVSTGAISRWKHRPGIAVDARRREPKP